MTISEAKKGGLKIHSRRKKNKSRIKKKQTKQKHDIQNNLEKIQWYKNKSTQE